MGETDIEAYLDRDKPLLDVYWEEIRKRERRFPNQNDLIYVSGISENDPEYEVLIRTDVTLQDIKQGRIRREFLINAGYIFNNYPLPYIEKPLLNIEINGIDFSKRKLLTKEELELVLDYQRQNSGEYGTQAISEDDFRKKMLLLLLSSDNLLPNHVENKVNFFRLCRQEVLQGASKELFDLYYAAVTSNEKHFAVNEQEFIKDKLLDLMPWQERNPFVRFDLNIRGKRAMSIESRRAKLNGIYSPFLDSGFIFNEDFGNPDFVVMGENGRLFRINMMVLHLASRGLSEMGEGSDNQGEQDYSIGNYLQNLDIMSTEQIAYEESLLRFKNEFDEDELRAKVSDRLIDLSLQWAENSREKRINQLSKNVKRKRRKS